MAALLCHIISVLKYLALAMLLAYCVWDSSITPCHMVRRRPGIQQPAPRPWQQAIRAAVAKPARTWDWEWDHVAVLQ